MSCPQCDEQNPCLECGSTVPCNCCVDPPYSEDGCTGVPINSDCIRYNGPNDSCIPIVKPILLTTMLVNLIQYTKDTLTRLSNIDGSILINPINDSCDDKATISVIIDPDNTNQLELRDDGLFVPPIVSGGSVNTDDTDAINLSGDGSVGDPIIATLILDDSTNGGDNIAQITTDGLYVPPYSDIDCNLLSSIFSGDVGQYNTINRSSYDLHSSGDSGCQLVSPPTGFAVVGPGRESAFGSMEWFGDLDEANSEATSGETVLLYEDATTVDLFPKNGVNYQGIGQRKIKSFDLDGDTYVGSISNLIILGSLTVDGVNSEIFATNVEMKTNAVFSSNVKWHGGRFTGNNVIYNVAITNNSFVEGIYSNIRVNIIGNGTFANSTVVDLTATGHYTVFADASANVTVSPTLSNLYIYSLNCPALHTVSYNPDGLITINNVTAISDGDIGAILHGGNADAGGGIFSSNVTGRSSVAEGIRVVSNKDLTGTVSNTNWAISNLNGFSTTSPGINCINANLKHCNGYSVTSYGIQIGGSDRNSYNLNIIECVGESKESNGLKATRDIFISGGTYISRLNTSSGNPISIQSLTQPTKYFIVGVKTIAVNSSAYAIVATNSTTARISGCQFLNESVTTGVLGIYTVGLGGNITLRNVTIDSYGNIS